MTTRNDPIEEPSLSGPQRLHYVQGTLLDTDDFTDEQSYHRGRLARALQYLFGAGTVAGLRLEWRPEGEEVVVRPGLALDPLGRLIEIPNAACLRLREWFQAQRPEDLRNGWIDEDGPALLIADVFVRFRVREQGKTPAFAHGAFDATNAVVPSRLRDDYELGLVIREEAGARREALAAGDPEPPEIPRPDLDEILLAIPPLPGGLPETRERILDLWRDSPEHWADGRPPRLREHLRPRVALVGDDPTALGRDPSSLLLGRLAIPVDPPTTSDGVPIDREEAPSIDNELRRFVYALGHLTQPASEGTGP